MTTPRFDFPYPSPGDPVAEGADNIRALAEAVDLAAFLPGVGGALAGNLPAPGAPAKVRIVGGTTVATTSAAAALTVFFPQAATLALVSIVVTPGDTNDEDTVVSFDYRLDLCQAIYRRGGVGIINGAVRVNYIAFLLDA